ncbi:MAG TPA: hypothetical protein VJ345_01290 [Anaerolineales bacterium]|jgi:hypothetical protein|nr:hypothetical protein [Anaerolineales bacterium]HLF81248.1 hypothetical protein [Anaerolineales bacterium]
MAKRKQPQLTHGQHRRLRARRVAITVFAILIVASFVLSMVTNL